MTEPFGVGGVPSDILSLSEDLIAKGHKVYVATCTGILREKLEEIGVRFIELDFRFKGPAAFLKGGMALREIIKREKIDIVAPQSIRTTISCFFSLRCLPFSHGISAAGNPIPIVTTIHNVHSPVHFKYGGHILNLCGDYVIFESYYERNRLLASGLDRKKCCVIHSGIDLERFRPAIPKKSLLKKYGLQKGTHKIFGIVGRLSEEKGHQYLLKAFANVYEEDKNARLLIIGDGPLLDEAKKQSSSLGLDGVVIFTGLRHNIADYLSIMDVFVLSSTRESFPLAAREAMAAGKAVIIPRVGGCPEVVAEEETGILFEVANVEELTQAMRRIMKDGLYLQYGKAGRVRVEKLFSHRQWTNSDEEVYLRFRGPTKR